MQRDRSQNVYTLLSVLLFAVAGLLVWSVIQRGDEQQARSNEPRAITPRGDLAEDERSTIALFREASPSVVHITGIQRRELR